jgi:hypothetical protein
VPSAWSYRLRRASVAWRPMIAAVLIMLMAGHAIASSFSGYLHVHDNVAVGHHHHHGDDDHHHHDDGGQDEGASSAPDASLADLTIQGSPDPSDDNSQRTLHEHGSIVTLGLPAAAERTHHFERTAWDPPRPDSGVATSCVPSERPPRAA